MKTSIIVVNYNSRPYLENCILALEKNTDCPYEIIVIDNNSCDDSRPYLMSLKNRSVRFILNTNNVGFSRACNEGIRAAQGDLVVTMNPDVLVPPKWLGRMVWHLKNNPKTAAVGPKSLGIGGRQWAGPLSFSTALASADRKFSHLYRQQSTSAKFLIGCLVLFDPSILNLIGGFDERLLLGADDFDLALRIRREGYRLLIANDVLVKHKIHASFNNSAQDETERLASLSWEHFNTKWSRELQEYGWERLFNDDNPVFPHEKSF